MAGNLVPKQTIATRSDGSTYETTVHVRAEDDGATNFKIPNRGAPVSAAAPSRDPGLPDRTFTDRELADTTLSEDGHEVPLWTMASRNVGGKTEFYAPFDIYDEDQLSIVEEEHGVRIDPEPLLVPNDDHNCGLPVYRVIGNASKWDHASRESAYNAGIAYFNKRSDAKPKGEGDAPAPKRIEWSEFDQFDPRDNHDGTTSVSDIEISAGDDSAPFNRDKFVQDKLSLIAAKYGVTATFSRAGWPNPRKPTANFTGRHEDVYRFLDDYYNDRSLT